MHMRSIFTLILLTAATSFAWRSARAQTGIGTTTPDANAMLDIESTQKGVLMPSLSAAQQATLAAVLTPAEMGMLVRDAVTGKLIFWNGAAWKNASGTTLTATPMLSVSSTNNIALNPGTAVGDLITWDGTNWINMQPAVQHFSLTVDNRQPFLTLNYCIALVGVFPSRSSSEPFISEIELYAFNFAPKGFALCNGQLLSIAQNTALFSLMGTSYGGNGTSTFQLPNLQGKVPMHMGSNGTSNYVLGQTGGVESNTITR
jgi:microcystin-dependent protein